MTPNEWGEANRRYRRYRDFGAENDEVSWLLRKLGQLLKETEPEPDPDVWEWVSGLSNTGAEESGSDESNRRYRIPRTRTGVR